jgi:hypothetical protein
MENEQSNHNGEPTESVDTHPIVYMTRSRFGHLNSSEKWAYCQSLKDEVRRLQRMNNLTGRRRHASLRLAAQVEHHKQLRRLYKRKYITSLVNGKIARMAQERYRNGMLTRDITIAKLKQDLRTSLYQQRMMHNAKNAKPTGLCVASRGTNTDLKHLVKQTQTCEAEMNGCPRLEDGGHILYHQLM